jgi:hypothetical protein
MPVSFRRPPAPAGPRGLVLNHTVEHGSSGQCAIISGFHLLPISGKPSLANAAATPNPHRPPNDHRFPAGSFLRRLSDAGPLYWIDRSRRAGIRNPSRFSPLVGRRSVGPSRRQADTSMGRRHAYGLAKNNPEPVSLRDPTAGRSSPIRVRNNRGSAALARYRSPGGNVLQRRVRPTRPFPNARNGGTGRIGKFGAQHDQRPADHRCSRADRVANADPAAASDLDLSTLLSVLVRHNALENDALRAGVDTDLVDLV